MTSMTEYSIPRGVTIKSRRPAVFDSPLRQVGGPRQTQKAEELTLSNGDVIYACTVTGCRYVNTKLRSVFSHRVGKHIRTGEVPRRNGMYSNKEEHRMGRPKKAALPVEVTRTINDLIAQAVEARIAELSGSRKSKVETELATWRKRAMEAERKLAVFQKALRGIAVDRDTASV